MFRSSAFVTSVLILSAVASPPALWDGRLTIEVVDADRQRPLPARVYVRDESGRLFFLSSADEAGSAVRYEKRNWINAESVELHTTLSAHPRTPTCRRGTTP